MRDYYNRRVGEAGEPPKLTLGEMTAQLDAAYSWAEERGYLQKSFGYYCVDAHDVPGDHGSDLRPEFFMATGFRIEKDVREFLERATEVSAFTFIEFVYDHVAKPDERSGHYHSFAGCGWHFDYRSTRFDVNAARSEWCDRINRFLRLYGDGYELSAAGEVVRLAPQGFEDLVIGRAQPQAGDTNVAKLNHAIRIFRLARSTREERKVAVRTLADLLEFYRSQVKIHLLKQDEADLFNIANNYSIRHHKPGQKDDYDDVWLTWMFYTYLSTVRLILDLVHGTLQPEAETPAKAADTDDFDLPF